jgi:hypothetical protein
VLHSVYVTGQDRLHELIDWLGHGTVATEVNGDSVLCCVPRLTRCCSLPWIVLSMSLSSIRLGLGSRVGVSATRFASPCK